MVSRSSAASTTNSKQSQNQVGQEGDGVAISAGDGARIDITSQEAWALGEQVVNALAESNEATLNLVSTSLDQIGTGQRTLSAALEYQTQATKSEGSQFTEQLITVGAPALVIAFVAYGIFRT
jgi:hypothetical protein